MSLAHKLSQSPKIAFGLANQLLKMDSAAPEKKSLTIVFKASATLREKINGVDIRAKITDEIYTADVSLNGLQQLVDDKRIVSIQGGQPICPV